MYCKHCGKEIDDNSSFCNHCGKYQGDTPPDIPKNPVEIKLPKFKLSFTKKERTGLLIYSAWFIINLICIFATTKTYQYSKKDYFYPFENSSISYYDVKEFLVYAVLFPFIVFIVYKLWTAKIKE